MIVQPSESDGIGLRRSVGFDDTRGIFLPRVSAFVN